MEVGPLSHRHRRNIYVNPLPSDNEHKPRNYWKIVRIILLIWLGYTLGILVPAIHNVLNFR